MQGQVQKRELVSRLRHDLDRGHVSLIELVFLRVVRGGWEKPIGTTGTSQ